MPKPSAFIHATVRTHLLDGNVVLFDERNARLFALNSTASDIWTGLRAGMRAGEIAKRLSAQTGVAVARAADDVSALMTQWEEAGLVRSAQATAADSPRSATRAGSRDAEARDGAASARVRRAFRLMNGGFRVKCDADTVHHFDNLFGHLSVAPEEAKRRWPVVELRRCKSRLLLSVDGDAHECPDEGAIAPLLYGAISSLAYRLSDCFAVFHAAAVAKGTAGVLLPGSPGSGKSTLAAALVAAGFKYGTDDLAILSRKSLRLNPVPLHIGLKNGSWAVLKESWPQLEALPTYVRSDGKRVKYLLPSGDRRLRPDTGVEIAAIVFPKFTPGAEAQLRPIAKSEGLARLAAAGYDLPNRLDNDSVRVLLEWLEPLPCFELRYDDLTQAIQSFSGSLS